MKNKKNIKTLLLCIIIAMSSLVLFVTHIVPLFREYRYAGGYNKWAQYEIKHEEGEPIGLKECNAYIQDLFNECKEIVQNSQLNMRYPYLNWEKLQNAEILHCQSVKLSDGTFRNQNILGKYHSQYNQVYLMPESDSCDREYLKRIIIHELIHCLTYSEEIINTVFYEAVAEEFAKQICIQNNIYFEYSESYEYKIWSYKILKNVFGEQEMISMLYNGNLESNIDKYTKKGYGNQLLLSLSYFCNQYDNLSSYDRKKLSRIIQDIITHLTANYAKEISDENQKKRILNYCKDMLIIDEKYFIRILEE